ncbi:MAG: ATP-binding cassette domain-containing protein [Ilumatobacteraceae bacterium]
MLEIAGLTARFGPVNAVRDVSMSVEPGELCAIVGPNGAGKTTLLRAVIGQHADRDGSIRVDGAAVRVASPTAAARAGVAIVPQGRRLFPTLTVREHVELSAGRAARGARRFGVDDLFAFFPGLARRLDVRAAMLSGGEQQMLAIGRAALLSPRYVLMDEPTEGLAPAIVGNVASLISHLPSLGMGVVITEQSDVAWIDGARTVAMRRGTIEPIRTAVGGPS